MRSSKNLTGLYAFCTAAFWMSYCVSVSFAAVFLQKRGYSNTTLGLILALGNVLAALLGPAMSEQIDRHAKLEPYHFLFIVLPAQALSLLLLTRMSEKSLALSIVYILLIAFTVSINSLVLKIYVDLSYRGASVDYGLSRGIGSLAYVVLSSCLGLVIKRLGIAALPYVGLAVTAVQLFSALLLRRAAPDGEKLTAEDVGKSLSLREFLKENPRYSILLFGTVLIFFAHNTIANFLINITVNAGGGEDTMGYLNAVMAFVEIPVIMFYARLRGKHSHSAALRMAFLFFIVKTAAFALVGSVPLLYAVMLLQAPSFALYTAAIVYYVNEELPHADSAKAQSLAFSMTMVGSVLSSVISGRNYDLLGVRGTLLVAAVVCVFGSLTAIAGLKKKASEENSGT
ncbi:MAG: MFS transporter [Oscillospiraceae bacterium]|nr:MFS transporter [Oscillospiraceae bacterium]